MCKQKLGETLREYAQRFSKQRTELRHILDHDVILAFVSGTTYRDLVRGLGRNRPQTVDELMDMVANYAAGEEAVGAFFSHEGSKEKAPVDDDEGLYRGSKKGKRRRRRRDHSSGRLLTMTSSPPKSTKSLEGPQRGPSSTRCSKSPTRITREG